YCSHVTLAELADLLASPIIGDFRIERALNLDGGSSSGFWFAGENGVFSIREQKTVRDYIAVMAK
ncbi:MAG: phosphodiester glycosidase family protein, partial [Chthoniobacterales bacterium]